VRFPLFFTAVWFKLGLAREHLTDVEGSIQFISSLRLLVL